jgi:nicotinamide-nucleotide amidase
MTATSASDLQATILYAASELGKLLRARGWKIATAESCTGGGVAEALTRISGSSEWFECGVVAYANNVKTRVLQVPQVILDVHGAVSEPVAGSMAQGVQAMSGSYLAVSVTGIAGPGGGSPTKPVGTVCFGIALGAENIQTVTMRFGGNRELIRAQSVLFALRRSFELAKV